MSRQYITINLNINIYIYKYYILIIVYSNYHAMHIHKFDCLHITPSSYQKMAWLHRRYSGNLLLWYPSSSISPIYINRTPSINRTISNDLFIAASLSMGLYAWYTLKPRMGSHAVMAYDLYFGYVVRFVVYSFCGMGLLWMQSTYVRGRGRRRERRDKEERSEKRGGNGTGEPKGGVRLIFYFRFTAVFVLVLMFVTTILLGVPLALSPLIIILIGFIISFYDEKTRRVEFFLLYYRVYISKLSSHSRPLLTSPSSPLSSSPAETNIYIKQEEILAYIRAKEQHELPMAVHAFGDIPVAPQHVNNDEDDGV